MKKVTDMIHSRVWFPLTLMLAASAVPAQTPPAAPLAPTEPLYQLAPPAPPARPLPPVAPMAPMAPLAPLDAPEAWEQLRAFKLDSDAMEQMNAFKMDAEMMKGQMKAFKMDTAPMAFFQNAAMAGVRRANDDRLYESGLSALDNHRYDSALEDFNQVAAHAGSRADGGWYWKAYTLNKLGRRDEAIAAIAELRKSFPGSRWLDDAKALELEVKQQSGQSVSPESESDEELKLMALNGLMQSDPERAIPLVENVLKGSNPPRVKQRALFVLAQSSSPVAQQTVEQIARGGGNPDLQLKAINYIGTMRRRQQGSTTATTPPILPEIYAASNDPNVKRAILNIYMANRDTPHLADVAKNEKSPDLRRDAFAHLGNNAGQPELWQIYQSETSSDVKEQILGCMYSNGNSEKLAEVARTDKDPKLRRAAVRVLSSQRSATSGDTFVSIYNAEQDPQNKQAIVDALAGQHNAKALVAIARNEKDTKMKLRIVDRLSNMKDKDAQDYLMEILSK